VHVTFASECSISVRVVPPSLTSRLRQAKVKCPPLGRVRPPLSQFLPKTNDQDCQLPFPLSDSLLLAITGGNDAWFRRRRTALVSRKIFPYGSPLCFILQAAQKLVWRNRFFPLWGLHLPSFSPPTSTPGTVDGFPFFSRTLFRQRRKFPCPTGQPNPPRFVTPVQEVRPSLIHQPSQASPRRDRGVKASLTFPQRLQRANVPSLPSLEGLPQLHCFMGQAALPASHYQPPPQTSPVQNGQSEPDIFDTPSLFGRAALVPTRA